MSGQVAGEPTLRPDASKKGSVLASLHTKGTTPVKVKRRQPFLSRYPDRVAVRLLATGFGEGFHIPCSLAVVPPLTRNWKSALEHPGVVGEKIGEGSGFGSDGGAVCG